MPDRFGGRVPVVLDLEATCWGEDQPALRGRQRELCEIIEIGAVRLDPHTLAERDHFRTAVRPARYPALSAFCTELTGITQAQVDAAPTAGEALAALGAWLGPAPPLLFAWGRFEREVFARVYGELGRANPFEGAYGDLRGELMAWSRGQGLGRPRVGLVKALEMMGLPGPERQHRALDDARSAARLLAALRDPARMSPEGRLVLGLALERHPLATHRGHVSAAHRERGWETAGGPRAWWPRVSQELARLGLAVERPGGGGLALTARALRPPFRRLPPPLSPPRSGSPTTCGGPRSGSADAP